MPFPPGGTSDILAPTIGPKLTAEWGQPVIVDNRPGDLHYSSAGGGSQPHLTAEMFKNQGRDRQVGESGEGLGGEG